MRETTRKKSNWHEIFKKFLLYDEYDFTYNRVNSRYKDVLLLQFKECYSF